MAQNLSEYLGAVLRSTVGVALALSICNAGLVAYVPLAMVTILIMVAIYRLSPLHPLYGFPGPVLYRISELPMFYHALRGTRHVLVKGFHDTYGSIVRTGPNTVSLTSMDAIRQIYTSSHALNKTTAYDMHSIKGEGLFFIKDKATHVRRRRIWNRSFSEEALSGYRGSMVSQIQNLMHWLLKRSEQDGKVDLVKIFPQYAYDSTNAVFFSGHAFSQSLLDSDDAEHIVAEASGYFAAFEFLGHAQPIFPILKHLPGISKFLKFETLATIAAERRFKNGPTFRDGISYWLEGDGGQPKLTYDDLPIESETVLIGGSDTVGAISTFAMYFLLANPKWVELLRQELDGTFHRDSINDHLDVLDKLVLLNAFVQETLRLGMPFSGLPRIVPPDGLFVNGRYIPKGICVNVPIWTHHVDETYYPNAYTFDPTRWIKDGTYSGSANVILTFGAGAFNCVGSKLAYAQLRILLANLLMHLDFTATSDFDAARFWNGVRNCRATSFLEPLCVRVVPRKH
ncbi:Cytochrome P450 67 [Mycena venus]|uniref:Cytochrome P450 67 n=1 Tax=Mycena venus TaxID=2733690 RepID=A0A8H6X8Y3_9AGAR|nr:Cytochrome P450 67 [Mycena venus]